jgi:hypothetical protein
MLSYDETEGASPRGETYRGVDRGTNGTDTYRNSEQILKQKTPDSLTSVGRGM